MLKIYFLTLSDEHKMTVSENRVLREILVVERNWEKLGAGECIV